MNNKLGRGAGYLTLGNLTFILTGYITNIWLAHKLGPNQYGLYGVITALMTLLNLVQTSGLPQSLTREITKKNTSPKNALLNTIAVQAITTTLLAALIIIFAPFFAEVLNSPNSINLIRLLAFILPLYGLYAIYSGYYSGLHQFRKQALLNVIYSSAKLLLIIILVGRFGLMGVILGFVLAPPISLIYGFVRPEGKVNLILAKHIYIKSIPLTTFSVISSMQLAVDLLLVKSLSLSPVSAGLYAACQSVAMIPYFGMSSISQVLLPGISKQFHSGDYTGIKQTISSGFRYLAMIIVPICLLISAMSAQVIQLLFGNKFIGGQKTLQVMMIAYMFLTLYMLMASAINGLGKAYRSTALSLLGVMVTFVLCLKLIPSHDLIGAAISVLIASVTILFLSIIATSKLTGFSFPILSLIRIFCAATSVSLLAKLINPSNIMAPLVGVACLLMYIFFLAVTGEFNRQELNYMSILFSRINRRL
jgi:stage V sporulation protein B